MAISTNSSDDYILELNSNPVKFEPATQITSVFYDNANRQVFSVRSGGAMGVVVKCPDNKPNIHFLMEDKGQVMELKFSPDCKILGIQRCQKSVEFVNYSNGQLDTFEYSQTCKGKNYNIIGFVWTYFNEVVLVTDHGLELYQVYPEKKVLKPIKTCTLPINWYTFHSETKLILLSTGPLCNIMHPVQFKHGNLVRQSKFEIDLPINPKQQNPPKLSLSSRDVFLAVIYGRMRVVVLKHQLRVVGRTEIVVYTLYKDSLPHKTNILRLNCHGKFGIHFLDNLIVVHHQSLQTSLIFDIKIPSETDGYVSYHLPLIQTTIKPYTLHIEILPPQIEAPATRQLDLYSPNWVFFSPEIVVDPSIGYLWGLQLHLEPMVNLIKDKSLLIDFLVQRQNSKKVILQVCREIFVSQSEDALEILSKIFDKLSLICKQHIQSESLQSTGASQNSRPPVIIDQSELYTDVFSVFEEETLPCHYVVSILLEYIRALALHQLQIPHYICRMLINILISNHKFDQLHQFLQYHIFSDSKMLACFLLSLQKVYPPSYQLGIDMLLRLDKSNEEVIDFLLSQNQILQALQFIRTIGNVDTVSPRKFLDIAKKTNDSALFFSVFRFFQQRNLRLRGSKNFEPGEHCETYVKHFESLFGVTLETKSSRANTKPS
ncbi:C18orf8 [Cordylochernes scorpioides]|uniref:C18orf8 n=1 Tax=Cordylochernes scorpioides TaxID=51811 RepID=A0ABY6KV09_9ARAC|nr:C18orf8 [Cordylochernes scorpioides]